MTDETRVIDGKYEVVRQLGEGGMGEVLLAKHMQLDQMVAIKILKAELTDEPIAVERFLREARAVARIQSEHVVRVFDVATLDDGHPYMVMEYLEGEDLSKRLESGPLPTDEAIDYVLQACVAIAEAHRVGVIHRDLKPGNLFIATRRDGTRILKVVDFGISKVSPKAGRAEEKLTTTQHLMGSPFYMSPEQLKGSEVDVRTDVWALGMILFELLTAEGPFDAPTMPQLCMNIIGSAARRLSEVRPDGAFPPGLEDVIERCLAKDVAERYADVVDLAAALTPFAKRSAFDGTRTPSNMPTKPPIGMTAAMPKLGLEIVGAVPPAAQPASVRDDGARVTSSSWDTPARGSAKKKKRRIALILAVAGVSLLLGVVVLVRIVGSHEATSNATSVSSESLPLPPPPTASVITTAPSASSSAPVAAPSVSVVSSARAVPVKTAPPKPTAAGGGDEFGGRK